LQQIARLFPDSPTGLPVHENDPATHFEPLLSLLAAVVVTEDYTNPTIDAQVGASTAAARNAGVAPEVVIAYLRHQIYEAPLSAVGDWYRSVLVERLVAQAMDAYFEPDYGAPPLVTSPAPGKSTRTDHGTTVDAAESSSPPSSAMSGTRDAFDVLLRAVASSKCELELAHIRALASTHHSDRLAVLVRAIDERRKELERTSSIAG
jgi:hypothetical protein